MVKVSIFYPREEGVAFDMDYYLNTHIPMVRGLLGASCRAITVDFGLAGGAPKAPAPFTAMAHLVFDSVETYAAAMKPHGAAIMADIKNYTVTKPVLQVSEMKVA